MKRFAELISKIGTHVLWVGFLSVVLGIIILKNNYFIVNDLVVSSILAIFTFTSGIFLKRRVDLDKKDRMNRTIFLGTITSGWVLISFLTWPFMSSALKDSIIIAVPTITVILINNIFYRISMHVSLTTSLLILINYFSGWNLAWAFIMIPFIAWSRIFLKKHSLMQVVMGFLIPVIVYLLVDNLFL